MQTFTSLIKRIKYLLAAAFWLGVWHVASAAIANTIVIVSPAAAVLRLLELVQELIFWQSVGFSLVRIVMGFLLGLGVGVLLAALSAASGVLYTLFLPAINAIKSIPVASFTILALMWISSLNLSIFIAFITVLPIAFFNTYEGIKSTDKKLLEMARVFCVPKMRVMLHIYGTAAAPYIVSAANSGLGFAFKAGIAAELIGLARGSIGFNLHTARVFLQTADVFAWTIAIIILSFAMEKLFLLAVRRTRKWQ